MVKCRNGCGVEVVHEDQHLIGTPEGDAWLCNEPRPERLFGKPQRMDDKTRAAIEADKMLVGRGFARIVGNKLEHIPVAEVIIFCGDVDPSALPKTLEAMWEVFNRHDSPPVQAPQMQPVVSMDGALVYQLAKILDIPDPENATPERILEAAKGLMAAQHPMFLTCPLCSARHIDEGEFAIKPHHTHACQSCGLTWRPMIAGTVGVQFLPGFKNK